MDAAPKRIEELLSDLQNSEHRYRRLFEAAQDGILILDAETGRIIDANPFLLESLGYAHAELLGKHLWEIGLFADREASEAAFAKLRKEGYIRYDDMPLQTKDGQRREVEFVSNLYAVDQQKVIQCNIRDITERKHLQAKLQQAQKMEVVGQLAGGVAHDFNNILTSTLLQLSMLKVEPSLPEGTKAAVEQLEKDAKRAAGLTRQLLLFSRQQVMQLGPQDLNAILTNLNTMLRRLLDKDVHLEFEAGSDALWIEADLLMIEQVITNLCLNAQDAMRPRGGLLKVEAHPLEVTAEAPRLNPDARPGMYVCLSVSDTGIGMDKATLKHLFEPFFTTKGVGKGTGLGLSIVYGITRQHGGWVEVVSALGKGSTFSIFLPKLERPVGATSREPFSVIPGGTETILLVEDEESIRDTVATVLSRFGYRIYEAADCQEAVRIWDEHNGKVDLLLADMKMPGGMTGIQLFNALKQKRPELKCIISSGYSDEILKAQEMVSKGTVFLPKPYDLQKLAYTVRTCLGAALHKPGQADR
jgi:two-component system cell cycle sensor histidine kinase/response regulator CckA